MFLCKISTKTVTGFAAASVMFLFISVVTAAIIYTVTTVDAQAYPLNVIIDTDPGADDAMAILMLLSRLSPSNLLAITVVTGNTGVFNGTINALLTLQIANKLEIPVYSGGERGLVYKAHSDNYFGEDGFGDTFENKPEIILRQQEHAAMALVNSVKKMPGAISLICTGPLTNIALAQQLYPEFLNSLKDIVILGGSYSGAGNVRPGVEFNIYADPEAAAFVFSSVPSGKLITVVPMETTLSTDISYDWRANTLGKLGTCFMDFINRAERQALPKHKNWLPHDQLATAVALNPGIVTSAITKHIIVETCGNYGRGAFFRDEKTQTVNAKIITEVDNEQLKDLLLMYMNNTSEGCLDPNKM